MDLFYIYFKALYDYQLNEIFKINFLLLHDLTVAMFYIWKACNSSH